MVGLLPPFAPVSANVDPSRGVEVELEQLINHPSINHSQVSSWASTWVWFCGVAHAECGWKAWLLVTGQRRRPGKWRTAVHGVS